MECEYFGVCGSCTLYELNYQEQLDLKVKESSNLLEFDSPYIARSKSEHFRYRAEFKIWHDGDDIRYAMSRLDKKGVVMIDGCSIVSDTISNMMPPLLKLLQADKLLEYKLFAIEFLSSTTKNLLVTLIYHKKVDELWQSKAAQLEKTLNIKVIGRSRGVKIVCSDDFIDESLTIDNKLYHYRLYDTGFIQPNLKVNEKMIEWVLKEIEKNDTDLLELYCGHGNFTIPLSQKFNKVLATEISKNSIKAARHNCKLNDITNIEFVRLSSEDLTSAMNKEREFRRLKDIDLDSYNFSHIFVDPPRAGLDKKSLEFISKFENIIYISCNPITLKRDLDLLKKSFKVVSTALFDQFAYTTHIESGVVLKRVK